jgi:8-hydroxy-5-deazaflavin:NADPH oxidoreductase
LKLAEKIADYSIIGSGALGGALATRFSSNDIEVLLANSRGPASLTEMVGKLGPKVRAASVNEAAAAAVVILAVPFSAVPNVVSTISDWAGRIVVDATNAIDLPSFKPKDLGGRLSSEIVAELVRGARVVKAFNTLSAGVLASDSIQDRGRRVIFTSSDDADARAAVAALCKRLGFYPIDLGAISEGGRLQHFGGPLSGQNLVRMD